MILGFRIIRESTYRDLVRADNKFRKVLSCNRWFAGWRDLDIIWNYIIQDTNFGGIEKARSDYARARGTNEYGEVKP